MKKYFYLRLSIDKLSYIKNIKLLSSIVVTRVRLSARKQSLVIFKMHVFD